MQRRIIAAVAAVVLAGIGAVLLYTYVNSADARAMANMETTEVLVATKTIPSGTSGASLTPFVETKQLPRVAVGPNPLTDTTAVTDLVTTTDIQAGEQVLLSRFAEPNVTSTGEVDVPTDLMQLTVQLEPKRVIGTNLKAGDKVGVFISIEANQVALTKLAFRDVLVSRIQGAPNVADGNGDTAPSADVLVTLAITPKDATAIVWGHEFGKVYLGLEPKDGDHDTTNLIRVKDLFG
ncbi:MAG: hypothetical protein KDB60_04790 [Propionibacteriaceae bacterium]|nr:hypothetical protein [Propionibacteriaceae bacterium]